MKVVTRIMLGFVAILLCGITACQVHYYKARRTPAVSGKIVDIETGEPIKGADVSVQVFGFPSDPIAAIASPPKWQLAGDMLKTDSQGSFSFPSQVPPLEDSGVSWWSYILWGPDKQTGIGVNVYTKDHITVASDSEGFEWKLDDFYETYFRGENNEKLVTVERERKGERSFEYTIKVKTAITERDWEIKCKDTILHTRLGREPDETWLFNDLVGYLERFPEGEKAGDYYKKAWATANLASCSYSKDALERKAITKEQLKTHFNRKKELLFLAKNLKIPPHGLDNAWFKNHVVYEEKQMECVIKIFTEQE